MNGWNSLVLKITHNKEPLSFYLFIKLIGYCSPAVKSPLKDAASKFISGIFPALTIFESPTAVIKWRLCRGW